MLLWCVCTVIASNAAAVDPQRARKLAKASYIVSSVGIVVTIVILGLVIGLIYSGAFCDGYWVHGGCYLYRSSGDTPYECSLKHGILVRGYCYYN